VGETILVSAGEASGDNYAAEAIRALRQLRPHLRFAGCAGQRMRAAGVEPVIRAESLGVVGLVEVVRHIPRIYGEFRKLIDFAERQRPRLALLTDSPDFNLRVAARLKRLGIPVIYLIAPQVWAWRQGRVRQIVRDVDHLLCIFPFEEDWFRERGVTATYIGHPLTRSVKLASTRQQFYSTHHLIAHQPVLCLLPGSRPGEIARHLPLLEDARARLPHCQAVLAVPLGVAERLGGSTFRERNLRQSIQLVEGAASDALAYSDVALAASGTITVQAALLGAPMVTYYRVSPISWKLGRRFVRVPYLTMVNLIAGRRVVPELMQDEATGERLAAEARVLLEDSAARVRMKNDLKQVAQQLWTDRHPMERAAAIIEEYLG
jgi:lipid-A-disaccharide synthase